MRAVGCAVNDTHNGVCGYGKVPCPPNTRGAQAQGVVMVGGA